MKNKKGFTLVELLAVIVILAILILLALPNVIRIMNNAKKNSFITEALSFADAAKKKYIIDGNGSECWTLDDLKDYYDVKDKYYGQVCINVINNNPEYIVSFTNSEYIIKSKNSKSIKIEDVEKLDEELSEEEIEELAAVGNIQIMGVSIQSTVPTPSAQVPVISLGEAGEIDVITSGKNILDYTKAVARNSSQTLEIINNGIKWSGDYYFKVPVNIKANKTITFSCVSENFNYFVFHYTDNTISMPNSKPTATTEKDVDAIYVYKKDMLLKAENMIFTNIQLVYGNKLTEYVPYEEKTTTINLTGHEPLRCVGNVCDYIDYKNGKIIRKIIKYPIADTEGWVLATTETDIFRFYKRVSAITGYGTRGNDSNTSILSDRFISSTTSNVESIKCTEKITNATTGLVNIGVLKTRIEYVEGDDATTIKNKFKQWLENNPTTIYYTINSYAKPIKEDITLPTLDLYSRNLIRAVDGTLTSH